MDKKKPKYRAVFISPHLDDAVFSCCGAIDKLTQEGPVLVLNIFTRYLSNFKSNAVVLGEERYLEEKQASQFLKYESHSLGELDAVFRRKAYKRIGNIFHPPVEEDLIWLPTLREKIFSFLSEIDYEEIYIPLGIGWHVDHILTYLVFEPWRHEKKVIYYEEVPYCLIPNSTQYRLDELAIYSKTVYDKSVVSDKGLRAIWETIHYYNKTAMMKNLKPTILRLFAIPVVSFYLYRLMAIHKKNPTENLLHLNPIILRNIDLQERKIKAMSLYKSQFKEFFLSQEDCKIALQSYGSRILGRTGELVERYWRQT